MSDTAENAATQPPPSEDAVPVADVAAPAATTGEEGEVADAPPVEENAVAEESAAGGEEDPQEEKAEALEERPVQQEEEEEPKETMGEEPEGGVVEAVAEEQVSSASDENNNKDVPEEAEGGGDAMEIEATVEEPSPVEDDQEGQNKQQQEASYSTRGRTVDAGNDPLERLAREALGELTREKPPSSSAMRESFLSDSITEEERRTRTRYIPVVDGMHALRKQEVKGDMSLARANFTSTGAAVLVASSKAKAKRGNSMEVDGDEGGAASVDDERASDILRLGTKTVEIGMNDLVLPSTAFLAPPPMETKPSKTTPSEVEAVTAFNPPRPPESIGPKKRHRMLRWERRPADIEVDLNNYRKTVHRTREELKNAQVELNRLESVDNHLRRHFLLHLQSLGEEWKVLNTELSAIQQDCVNSAELLTSRTRSRGAGKSSYAMRDVLTVLRTKGQEIEAKGLSFTAVPSLQATSENPSPGIGGVGAVSLEDWDRSTVIKPSPIASSWILPGDAVQTPYGDGTVVAVYNESELDVNEAPHKDLGFGRTSQQMKEDRMDIDERPSPGAAAGTETGTKAADSGEGTNKKGTKSNKKDEKQKTGSGATTTKPILFPLAPRVAVRLPFGVGFFPVKSLVSKEDPTTYSDARLALRWKGLLETAAVVGGVLDIGAMTDLSQMEPTNEDGMEIEEGGVADGGERVLNEGKPRLLPFGSGMLPTAAGRGDSLWKLSFEELDKVIDSTMFKDEGALGLRDNAGVPAEFRKQEDDRQELLDLRAHVLQLKNELYRQRRTRMLNEKTFAAGQERAVRVEALVAEMRTDLKTLKRRLDDEVAELGISDDVAERLLALFYESFDSKDDGEPALPAKRPRRLSRLETEDDDLDDDDDEQVDSSMELGTSM